MMRDRLILLAAAAALAGCAGSPSQQEAAPAPSKILSFDRKVEHVSTVPAIKGRKVSLALHEQVPSALLQANGGKAPDSKVVLFVNGAPWPSSVAYDLPWRDYSWTGFLARSGYDVFSMDTTGYGASPRPKMDDPCNVDPRQQPALVPKPLKAACKPGYAFRLVNSDSDDADIEAVVDFIIKLRGVDAVTLIGWGQGGQRVGRYAARHPYKVNKLVILASSDYRGSKESVAPANLPVAGFPTRFETRDAAETRPWKADAKCTGEIDPGIRGVVWKQALASDPVAAKWGAGGFRAPTGSWWGWTADQAAKIRVPTLVMVGADDPLVKSNSELYGDLGTTAKIYLAMQCASHDAMWEAQYATVQKATLEWLGTGTVNGVRIGRLQAAADGTITVTPKPKDEDETDTGSKPKPLPKSEPKSGPKAKAAPKPPESKPAAEPAAR